MTPAAWATVPLAIGVLFLFAAELHRQRGQSRAQTRSYARVAWNVAIFVVQLAAVCLILRVRHLRPGRSRREVVGAIGSLMIAVPGILVVWRTRAIHAAQSKVTRQDHDKGS